MAEILSQEEIDRFLRAVSQYDDPYTDLDKREKQIEILLKTLVKIKGLQYLHKLTNTELSSLHYDCGIVDNVRLDNYTKKIQHNSYELDRDLETLYSEGFKLILASIFSKVRRKNGLELAKKE
jgi:CRISPR/Cas system endoribonuclease Cas6 (RAMP superfamily)